MPHYIIKETFTTITAIEAENKEEALKKHGDQSPRDFDEIDQTAPFIKTIELDPEYET